MRRPHVGMLLLAGTAVLQLTVLLWACSSDKDPWDEPDSAVVELAWARLDRSDQLRICAGVDLFGPEASARQILDGADASPERLEAVTDFLKETCQ